jgi:hypothetical protein
MIDLGTLAGRCDHANLRRACRHCPASAIFAYAQESDRLLSHWLGNASLMRVFCLPRIASPGYLLLTEQSG